MRYLFYIILTLCLFHIITTWNDKEPEPIKAFEDPAPDSTRIPDHFDWENNRYIYKDELPPPDTQRWDRDKALKAMPDSYVEVIDGNAPRIEPQTSQRIQMSGKWYRVQKLGNGDIKLVEIR